MRTRLSPRALRLIVWTLACSPAVWFATFWLFVVRARLALGRWPAPYDPDPKDLGFSLHHVAIVAGMAGVFAATFTLLLFVTLSHREMKAAGARPLLAATVASTTLLAIGVFAQSDPGKFLSWFGD